MSNSSPRNVFDWLVSQRAMVLPVLYLFASSIGMFFYWVYFKVFGVNIFDFADVSDFLMMSFRKPITWLIAIAAGLIITFDNAMSRRAEGRIKSRLFAWYGSSRYGQTNYIAGVILIVGYIWLFATMSASSVLEGKGQQINVTLTDDPRAVETTMLGSTTQFLFLFDDYSMSVAIHPFEQVHSIEVVVPEENRPD